MASPVFTFTLRREFTSVTLNTPSPSILTLSPSSSLPEITANISRKASSLMRFEVLVATDSSSANSGNVSFLFICQRLFQFRLKHIAHLKAHCHTRRHKHALAVAGIIHYSLILLFGFKRAKTGYGYAVELTQSLAHAQRHPLNKRSGIALAPPYALSHGFYQFLSVHYALFFASFRCKDS